MTDDSQDLESGTNRITLDSDTNGYEITVEPIPSIEEPKSKTTTETAVSSSQQNTLNNTEEHNVIPRTTTLGYMWRRHVQSRTDNPTILAVMERLLLVFLFFSSMLQAPLDYILGNGDDKRKKSAKANNAPLIKKGLVETRLGAVGYLMSEGRQPKLTPILCFHASPRCSDEFLEVLPLLAATGRRVVAMDIPGYGFSENPKRSCSIDDIADAFLKVADSLLIDKFVTVGCLMGNFVAVSLAARYSNRVLGCIHAHLLYYPVNHKMEREEKSTDAGIAKPDSYELKADGSHLLDLHNKRKWLEPELNLRVIQGELVYLVNRRQRYAKGISIQDVSDFDLEKKARRIRCPTMCIRGESALAYFDAIDMGGTQRFHTASRCIPHSEIKCLYGPRSTVNMINQAPDEFVSLCTTFLEKNSL